MAPIHDAARDGDLQRVTAVLDAGGNVNRKDWVRPWCSDAAGRHVHTDAAPPPAAFRTRPQSARSARSAPPRAPRALPCTGAHVPAIRVVHASRSPVACSRAQYGRTALHDASVNDHLQVVKLLLQRGADVRVMNQFGDTSLHEAGRWGHLEVVRLLLDNQADMSMTNQHGWTPLHFAAAYSQLEVARVLLEAGADVKAKDNVRARLRVCAAPSLARASSLPLPSSPSCCRASLRPDARAARHTPPPPRAVGPHAAPLRRQQRRPGRRAPADGGWR
jgi:hypothetical protein